LRSRASQLTIQMRKVHAHVATLLTNKLDTSPFTTYL